SCTGSHFPQGPNGAYAGYHPENGAAAIKHLEELRERGAQFLLIPQTSFWWFDHYTDFRDYLNQRFSRVIDQPEICVLFDLARAKEKRVSESIGASDPSIEVRESPVTNRTTPEPRAFGVNISGHLTSEKGVGEAVRAQIRSFTTVSVPLALNDYPDDN